MLLTRPPSAVSLRRRVRARAPVWLKRQLSQRFAHGVLLAVVLPQRTQHAAGVVRVARQRREQRCAARVVVFFLVVLRCAQSDAADPAANTRYV